MAGIADGILVHGTRAGDMRADRAAAVARRRPVSAAVRVPDVVGIRSNRIALGDRVRLFEIGKRSDRRGLCGGPEMELRGAASGTRAPALFLPPRTGRGAGEGECRNSKRSIGEVAVTVPEGARRCPRCGSGRIQHSHRRGLWERILHAFGGQIRRCLSCNGRDAWFGWRRIPLGQGRRKGGPFSAAVVIGVGLALFLAFFWWFLSRLAGRMT